MRGGFARLLGIFTLTVVASVLSLTVQRNVVPQQQPFMMTASVSLFA